MRELLDRITTKNENPGGDPVRGIYFDGVRVGAVAQNPSMRPLAWVAVNEITMPDGRTGYGPALGWAREMKTAALHLPALAALLPEQERWGLEMGGRWGKR
jgi:hypothetical protein